MLLLLLLPFASPSLAIARPPASHCLLPCQNLGLVGGKHNPTIRGVFQAFPLLSCALSFFSFLLVLSCPVLSYLSLTDRPTDRGGEGREGGAGGKRYFVFY